MALMPGFRKHGHDEFAIALSIELKAPGERLGGQQTWPVSGFLGGPANFFFALKFAENADFHV
eukprot:scaffold234442_cov37-Prasinocladus_malaysianus.AAC.2